MFGSDSLFMAYFMLPITDSVRDGLSLKGATTVGGWQVYPSRVMGVGGVDTQGYMRFAICMPGVDHEAPKLSITLQYGLRPEEVELHYPTTEAIGPCGGRLANYRRCRISETSWVGGYTTTISGPNRDVVLACYNAIRRDASKLRWHTPRGS